MDLLLLAAATHDPTIEISDPIVHYDYRKQLLRMLLLLWMFRTTCGFFCDLFYGWFFYIGKW